MINLHGNGVFFDLQIGNNRLTDEIVKRYDVEVFSFRAVYTAGIAIPTYQFHISANNEKFLRTFNLMNDAKMWIGTSPDKMDCFELDIVGHHVKQDAQLSRFVLYCGATLKKGNLNSKLLEMTGDEAWSTTAIDAMRSSWDKNIGTGVDFRTHPSNSAVKSIFKRHKRTLPNFLAELQLYSDVGSSFPLTTINKDGELVITDFQTELRKANSLVGNVNLRTVPVLAPSDPKTLKAGQIPYIGMPEQVSYKSYVNRALSYTQVTTRNTLTGENETKATSIADFTSTWNVNRLSTSTADMVNPIDQQTAEINNVLVDNEHPAELIDVMLHNKTEILKMSSISVKVVVVGEYLNSINVLDIVKLKTGIVEDKMSGLYIVEAIEQGFVYGGAFANILWLCRENENDVQNLVANSKNRLGLKQLNISPAIKANLINATRLSRRALIGARMVLDGQYITNYENYLISMKTNALTSFNLYNTQIDLNSTQGAVRTAQAAGTKLLLGGISKFVSSPYDTILHSAVTGKLNGYTSSVYSLFMSLLSALFGPDIYSCLSQIYGDLFLFNTFLSTYDFSIDRLLGRSNDYYFKSASSGDIVFKETPSGDIVYEVTGTGEKLTAVTSEVNNVRLTGNSKITTTEAIVAEIQSTIPPSVDLPIPEIDLDDSDLVKPKNELKDEIIDIIIDDLVDKGYIYDDNSPDIAAGIGKVLKANGEAVTPAEARTEMASASSLKSMLKGTVTFDLNTAKKISNATGSTINTRHWGTFSSFEELTTFNLLKGYVERYKSVACTKRLSIKGGQRLYIALPSRETNIKFYINSSRVDMVPVDVDGLGYKDASGKEIPYTVYYSIDGYNSNNVLLEIRKEV